MSLLILTTGIDEQNLARAFQDTDPDLDIHIGLDSRNLDAVRFVLAWKQPPGSLTKLKNLEVIFSLGAGVDHLLRDPHIPDVRIVRFVDPNLTQRMVEYVVLHVLAHHRYLQDYISLQEGAEWRELDQPIASDVNVGIMGLGQLGMLAAHALRDLGFNVQGWSRSPKNVENITCFAGQSELASFLEQTEILVCLLPLTSETKNILDRQLLAKLGTRASGRKPALINAGRGGLQKEADIERALREGDLRGATLDVFNEEPLPPKSSLWKAPNLFITPHNAATSDDKAIARYVSREYGREMRTLVTYSMETMFIEPEEPRDWRSTFVMEKYKKELSWYYDKLNKYREQKAKVFTIIKGQCSLAMKNKVKSMANYKTWEWSDNVIELLKMIKDFFDC